MKPIIQVSGLSKYFRLSQPETTLREAVGSIFKTSLGKRTEKTDKSFWALRDVSFEVKAGEAAAFVGRNGAGKSTLLKILSRVVAPTTGEINIYGHTSSLLEIGTGFHPDLSGRENIFLNGVMLGMTRHEIKLKFDEIVAFSGVARFLETPIKYYSSGMYLRLAFAVAVHCSPELLILDEVLAVGDANFQEKCLKKIEQIRNNGCAVILVTHDLMAIQKFCDRAFLLENGFLCETGSPAAIVDSYIKLLQQSSLETIGG